MSNKSEYDWAMHDDRVRAHYAHAIEKHPYFCDWIFYNKTNERQKEVVTSALVRCRTVISDHSKGGRLHWYDLLNCEMWEVFDALVNGDRAHAVEELYDMIAVCLRTIDVLEGRQKLGKPETEGGAK